MPPSDRRTATRLLQAWRGGDRAALDQLLPVVYDELSGLAHRAPHVRISLAPASAGARAPAVLLR